MSLSIFEGFQSILVKFMHSFLEQILQVVINLQTRLRLLILEEIHLMIFRQPSNGSCKIGRKIEFNNPLRYSNKKHYWNGGVANYGLLTTEQIEMLNEMKQREKRAHLYDIKGNGKGLNYSIKEIKYRQNAKQQKLGDYYQAIDCQVHNVDQEAKQKETLRQPKSKRSVSEFRSYEEGEHSYEKFTTIDHQQTPTGLSRINKDHMMKRLESGKRRVKTIGMEELRDMPNPQERNRIDDMFNGLVDLEKQKPEKKHLRMQSGNIRVDHSPETLKNLSKSIENTIPSLQPQIYSDRSQQQTQIDSFHKIQPSQHNLLQQQPQKIERKFLKLDNKRLTRLKFKRDHSPTFCNSIDYPLKYFRHI